MLVIRRNLLVLPSRHCTYNNNSPTDHQKAYQRSVWFKILANISRKSAQYKCVTRSLSGGSILSAMRFRQFQYSFLHVNRAWFRPIDYEYILFTNTRPTAIVTLDWSESMTMTDTQVIPSHLICFLMWCNGFMGNTCLHIDSDPNLSNNK